MNSQNLFYFLPFTYLLHFACYIVLNCFILAMLENQIEKARSSEEFENAKMFRDAASRAKVKTFKYDPTKVVNKK